MSNGRSIEQIGGRLYGGGPGGRSRITGAVVGDGPSAGGTGSPAGNTRAKQTNAQVNKPIDTQTDGAEAEGEHKTGSALKDGRQREERGGKAAAPPVPRPPRSPGVQGEGLQRQLLNCGILFPSTGP